MASRIEDKYHNRPGADSFSTGFHRSDLVTVISDNPDLSGIREIELRSGMLQTDHFSALTASATVLYDAPLRIASIDAVSLEDFVDDGAAEPAELGRLVERVLSQKEYLKLPPDTVAELETLTPDTACLGETPSRFGTAKAFALIS